jgi:hypothetical protein
MAYTTINKGSSYFNTVLYTGTQTQQTINVGFQPDFVWIKSRSNVQVHALFDAVRGTSIGALQSNATAAENANQKLVAYTSTGFTLPSVNYEWTNTSGWTFAAWNWLGANTTTSNTSGTITSTVSANTTSGFSIVSFDLTGQTGVKTVGHGLGTAPKVVITKRRSGGAGDWTSYFGAIGNSYLVLNSTAASATSANFMNNTAPTSSVFTVGDPTWWSQSPFIAYCFAEVKGYSKFGSYTGNGSADGTFVYTGFKPAFVIIKQTSSSGEGWEMADDVRSTYNVISTFLRGNSDAAESTNTDRQFDFLSNGIKMRGSHGSTNGSGATYIYMCFAENPFVTSGGIPVTAR